MNAWTVDDAKQLYSLPFWSEGYFDVDNRGRICAQPLGPEGPRLPIPELIERACVDGVKLPLLLRFGDILPHRLQAMQRAFNAGMGHLGYKGGYTAVYPIKVNQHFGVAGVLAALLIPFWLVGYPLMVVLFILPCSWYMKFRNAALKGTKAKPLTFLDIDFGKMSADRRAKAALAGASLRFQKKDRSEQPVPEKKDPAFEVYSGLESLLLGALALMLVFLAILVVFCLADSLFTSTTMVRMSPTCRARLSASSNRAEDSLQREPLAASP